MIDSWQRSQQEESTGEWTRQLISENAASFRETFHCYSGLAKPSQVTASSSRTGTGLGDGYHPLALMVMAMRLHPTFS